MFHVWICFFHSLPVCIHILSCKISGASRVILFLISEVYQQNKSTHYKTAKAIKPTSLWIVLLSKRHVYRTARYLEASVLSTSRKDKIWKGQFCSRLIVFHNIFPLESTNAIHTSKQVELFSFRNMRKPSATHQCGVIVQRDDYIYATYMVPVCYVYWIIYPKHVWKTTTVATLDVTWHFFRSRLLWVYIAYRFIMRCYNVAITLNFVTRSCTLLRCCCIIQLDHLM